MLGWNHYKFRQKLALKAEHCLVHEVTEEYTSKTCGSCGRINHDLKGEKIYDCKHCEWKIGRDMNGARNILMMNLEKCRLQVIDLL